MRWILGLFAAAVLATSLSEGAFAQGNPKEVFVVGDNVLVSGASAGRPLVEPQLVANPKDPNHLLGVAIVSSEPPHSPQADCAAFASFDGGRTWSRHDFRLENCGDPWVALREDGTALFTGLGPRGEIRLSRSTDGGRTWAPVPVDLGRGHDHETVILDATGGPRAGSFYVVSGRVQRNKAGRGLASVFVARSRDSGKTFAPPADIVASSLSNNALAPAVLADGALVVPFIDYQSHPGDHGGAGMLERRRVWALISSDGGQTFSHPMFVSEACGSGGGFASLAADASTRSTRDRLYLVCTNRDRDAVLVHHSADRGETWSAPVRAASSGGDVVFRRTPSIAVNKDGVVGVTWYERRKEKDGECQHVYFTASLDGGKSFLPAARVSTAPSCPDTPRNGGSAKRWAAGGDYSGLTASPDGAFHVLWADSRNGIYQLWTARVSTNMTVK
ncbi:MAG: glycoside hydrolase [Acidobacteria bacterium]|nr:glycoside hydrolase [Acidobacteriota bacterium]